MKIKEILWTSRNDFWAHYPVEGFGHIGVQTVGYSHE